MSNAPDRAAALAAASRAYRARRRRGLVLVTIRAEVPAERAEEFRARVAQVVEECNER